MPSIRLSRGLSGLCLSLLLVLSLLPIRVLSQRRLEAPRPATRPRLVLLIAIDQFRYDYLQRFGDLFGQNGFRRLLRDGASWAQADYDHVPTNTAPGHATMMTGAWPAETGIVSNEWPDRDTGTLVTSVSDPTTALLGSGGAETGASPRRLMASTVGDELKFATAGRSKVVGISAKDRSAILPVGRRANAAYWLSSKTGGMVSSSYYFESLPDWVQRFNQSRPADKYFGARWDRALPEAEYIKRAGPDAPEWEKVPGEKGNTESFPHIVTGGADRPNPAFYDAFGYTPFMNDLLETFAEQAVQNEQLGADEDTDVLSVSFSANDLIGHRYGPYSHETMDAAIRVDRTIGKLLDFVDARVGLRNTVVVLTADHGVAPIPEQAASLNLPAGIIDRSALLNAIRAAIKARYNPKNESPDRSADYIWRYRDNGRDVDAFSSANLYFNPVALKRDGVDQQELERIAGDAAMTIPGVRRYFTRTQLSQRAVSPDDALARRVLHGFYPRRSGDLILVIDPYKFVGQPNRTSHGSPYTYDTHVPLVIMGQGITPGLFQQAAAPSDIAPTLSVLLDVQLPSNSVGRVLTEALTERRDHVERR